MPPLASFAPLRRLPPVLRLREAAAGGPCHLVGGVLRDQALGLLDHDAGGLLGVHDVDAVIAGRGREIADRLAAALPARLVLLGGKEFAAYRLVGSGFTLDLWDREGMSLEDDLARRDFTVDSIAYDPASGEVADPFGGLADLDRRLLRATTVASFAGDPLRVLRLPRLILQLPGFAPEPATVALARRSASALPEVAPERIRDELDRILTAQKALRGVELLAELDLYPGFWLGRPGEPGTPAVIAGAMAELAALEEVAGAFRGLAADLPASGAAGFELGLDLAPARRAALFAHLPEPPAALERFRDEGYLSRQNAADTARLLDLGPLPRDEPARRTFLHRAGPLWPAAACSLAARAAARGEEWRAPLAALAGLAHREGGAILDPPRLVTGEEVQALLGIPPGRRVGEALAAVREAQVQGEVRTKEEAVELVRGLGSPTGRSPTSARRSRRRPGASG